MTVSPILCLTQALRGRHAAAAVERLAGTTDPAGVEGLVELIYAAPSAPLVSAAIAALAAAPAAIVLDGLATALDNPHTPVRLAALAALQTRRCRRFDQRLGTLVRRDGAWTVRRAALRALADAGADALPLLLPAATDPHWRVRHALVEVLRTGPAERRAWVETELARDDDPRSQGVRAYLHYRNTGAEPQATPAAPAALDAAPFWDPDPFVLARLLGEAEPADVLPFLPALLTINDARIRRLCGDLLQRHGGLADLAAALALLAEPRHNAVEELTRTLARLDLDRLEACARFILRRPANAPAVLAWAIDQAGPVFPPEEEQAVLLDLAGYSSHATTVQAALARLAGRWDRLEQTWLREWLDHPDSQVHLQALRSWQQRHGREALSDTLLQRWSVSADAAVRREAGAAIVHRQKADLLEPLLADEDAGVRCRLAEALAARGDNSSWRLRLLTDAHPYVRAAALTPERAAELVEQPDRETSWHVLARAALLCKVPLWKLAPNSPWQPSAPPAAPAVPLAVARPAPPRPISLGNIGPVVAPLILSGHYGLPLEGFVRAAAAGVNLFFWEPNYYTLTEFAVRLPAAERNQVHFMAGTFEAEPERIRRDVERVLRSLKIERLTLFMLFWVQSWRRVTPEVRRTLDELRDAGKIGGLGLSTHSRTLAVEALDEGWNPVMVRHSAAHRTAEERVLPAAVRLGATILTFNCTCYGRLLQGPAPPTAADCYRYSLAQPGVAASLAAPATLEQLHENLQVLHDAALPPEGREHLQRHGAQVYREDTIFRQLIRSR